MSNSELPKRQKVAGSIPVAGSSFSTYLPMRGGFTPPTTDPFVTEGKVYRALCIACHCPLGEGMTICCLPQQVARSVALKP